MNIVKSVENVASINVLAIAAGVAAAFIVWEGMVAPKIIPVIQKANLGKEGTTLVLDGVGAVSAQVARGFLPTGWRAAADAMTGTLVYMGADSFLTKPAGS